jgi:hypothetical protein
LLGLLLEGLTGQTNGTRRACHDYIAGTRVVLLRGGQIPAKYRPGPLPPGGLWPGNGHRPSPPITQEGGGLTALVLAPGQSSPTPAQVFRWRWALNTLIVVALLSTVALPVLGGMWWFQRHNQPSAASGTRQDQLFLALVENLSLKADTFTDKQAAALALASTQDPRAVTLLVDLLAQTGDPGLLNTLQQALVTMGPPAIPHLQRLNLTLANDVLALPPEQRLLPQLRLRTVKQTLAKILVLHSGHLNDIDLRGTTWAMSLKVPMLLPWY